MEHLIVNPTLDVNNVGLYYYTAKVIGESSIVVDVVVKDVRHVIGVR